MLGPLKWVGPLPPWLTFAVHELFKGVKEIRGGENPRILFYHEHTKLKATEDEVPWCSAFANACMYNSGFAGTYSAAARSWVEWGEQVTEYSDEWMGCLAVLWRGSPDSWQGHVGFVVNMDDKFVWLLGGNQKDAVTVSRYPRNQILSLRWPTGYDEDEYYPMGSEVNYASD